MTPDRPEWGGAGGSPSRLGRGHRVVYEVVAARRSLQSELLAACRPAVSSRPPPPVPTPGRSLLPRSVIVRIVRELVDRYPDECPSMEELASAADVSERTLRNVFVDYFGVPPRSYLTVRRLHQVRAVLRSSDPGAVTVTAVAARFGFWHFGRFAGEYRRLFGERQSETLYRSPARRTTALVVLCERT